MHKFVENGGYACLSVTNLEIYEPVSCTKFDNVESLLWFGTETGRVASIVANHSTKYTAFPISHSPVLGLQPTEYGLLSLFKDSVNLNSRTGLNYCTIKTPNMQDLTCFHIMKSNPSNVILRGNQKTISIVDLNVQKETRVVFDSKKSEGSVMRENDDYIFTSDASGSITLRNKTSLECIGEIKAHKGTIVDFDICGNKLITCGMTFNYKGFCPESYIKVFDLRTLNPLPPIALDFAPRFCRFLPENAEDMYVAVSVGGEMVITNLYEPQTTTVHVDNDNCAITALDVSLTNECISIGDQQSFIHIFSNCEVPNYNYINMESVYADPFEQLSRMDFDEMTSLSMVPYKHDLAETLISDWPEEYTYNSYRYLKRENSEILKRD
uniref:PAB-dependent poly(A)-specific ribonuclease subunit 2 n=1 Tax=Rhabditophanes sp. KR3021 TaxID=114890 RepID=A0AC35UCJ7_9BILA